MSQVATELHVSPQRVRQLIAAGGGTEGIRGSLRRSQDLRAVGYGILADRVPSYACACNIKPLLFRYMTTYFFVALHGRIVVVKGSELHRETCLVCCTLSCFSDIGKRSSLAPPRCRL